MRGRRTRYTGSPSGHLRRGGSTPREIVAKWGGRCGCGVAIAPGDQVMYYPAAKRVECWGCSQGTREALDDEQLRGGAPWWSTRLNSMGMTE